MKKIRLFLLPFFLGILFLSGCGSTGPTEGEVPAGRSQQPAV